MCMKTTIVKEKVTLGAIGKLLERAISKLATKEELSKLAGTVSKLATKEELSELAGTVSKLATKSELSIAISKLATKDEMNKSIDDLAGAVKKGFDEVHKKLTKVDEDRKSVV